MAGPDLSTTRRSLVAGLAVSLAALPARAQGPAPAPAAPTHVLRARPVKARLAPEAPEPAELWLFGEEPGPAVLTMRHGEELRLEIANDTPAPLSLHACGLRGPNAADGTGSLTETPLGPGAKRLVRLTPPDAGTFLLRPCLPARAGEAGRSSEPAGRGLAALLVVEEREPPKVDLSLAAVVRDWLVSPAGTLAPFGDIRQAGAAGRLGNRLATAGGDAPQRVTAAPGTRVRLRLANACNARIMRVRFDGAKVFVAAVDGQPTETFEPLRSSLPFPPATRYDLLFDLPAEPDKVVAVTALIGDGVPLVELRTSKDAAIAGDRPPPVAPPLNPLLPPEIRLQNAVRRDITLGGGAARNPAGEIVYPTDPKAVWTVNGSPGRLDGPPLASARRGQPVVFGITNATGFPQPLHIHGHVLRLLHPLDDGWEPYWVDTFQVPEGKTVHVALLADNPGRWLLGSAVLERLDGGLFGWYEVT